MKATRLSVTLQLNNYDLRQLTGYGGHPTSSEQTPYVLSRVKCGVHHAAATRADY